MSQTHLPKYIHEELTLIRHNNKLFRNWLERRIFKDGVSSDPRMRAVPIIPRGSLYHTVFKMHRNDTTMYEYRNTVFKPSAGSFELFGIDCVEVPGFDNSKRSIRSKIRFNNVRSYVIDFNTKFRPRIFVFEPKRGKPRFETIEVRLITRGEVITKYFKFCENSEREKFNRMCSIMGINKFNEYLKKSRPTSA